MATVLQLEMVLDNKGVVTGIQQVKDQISGLPAVTKKGAEGMNQMGEATERAHQAGQLLTRTLGGEMPRTLENIIAKSKLVGPVLNAAFDASVVLALGAALVNLGPELAHGAQ